MKRFVISTVIPKSSDPKDYLESFEEFRELVKNLGGEIVGEIIQKRENPDSTYFIGKGKLEDIMSSYEFDVLAIDSRLSSAQIANLRQKTGKEVMDREYVIIKIFESRATTHEGKLQVKLAELRYHLAKLSGIGKEMSQLGGILGTRGPGETKTEEIRRHIARQIKDIEKELEDIRRTREIHRKRRKKQGFFTISLVGYTNVGKSTLLRVLSSEDVEVKNQLFTTLETRVGTLIGAKNILISDTVGFIRNIPHTLIEAFKSTLEEVKYSDAIVMVLDISSDFSMQFGTIRSVLEEIGVEDSKPRIIVFNKIDLVSEAYIKRVREQFPSAFFVSAVKLLGINELKNSIKNLLTWKEGELLYL